MKKLVLPLVLAALLTSCNTGSASSVYEESPVITKSETETTIQTIGSQETRALLEEQKDIVILDVRTQEEYASGHLKNAQHIDYQSSDFPQRLQALDQAKTYVVYCAVGGRSRKAIQMMAKTGFKQVYDASEGFSGLKDAGVPVE